LGVASAPCSGLQVESFPQILIAIVSRHSCRWREISVGRNASVTSLTERRDDLIAAASPQWRCNWWGRLLLVAAALGYKKWMSYTWDTPYMNYPDSDQAGTAQVINDVHVNVAGKTIKNAFYNVGVAVTLQFTDGSSFAI
jgi:hypothetical protein